MNNQMSIIKSKTHQVRTRCAGGFTLIECLIVVLILALLLQAVLPAVESSRESARKLSCSNNLRQIALALQVHEETYERLPSGGWYFNWAGEPELGTGLEQPGGWIFNILDFIDEHELRDLGMELEGTERASAFGKRLETPISILTCPSRRLPRAYPLEWSPLYYSRDGMLDSSYSNGAKTDFAACVGASTPNSDLWEFEEHGWTPPETLDEGSGLEFIWPDDQSFARKFGVRAEYDGAIYARSQVRLSQVTDGLSKLYLVGEKCVSSDMYKNGHDPGDQEHMYAGGNDDSLRSAMLPPQRDKPKISHNDQFGSVHLDSWNMAFADGSVRPISFDIFLEVHRRLGSRSDGKTVALQEQ